jgi:hypothetical protein
MRVKSPVKSISCNPELIPYFKENEYHTIFSYNFGKSNMSDLYVGEPLAIRIFLPSGDILHYGMAEVISIKEIAIRNLEKIDLDRQPPEWRTIKDAVLSLRQNNPKDSNDINLNTPITVITYKQLKYDLNELNKIVKSDIKRNPPKKEDA